jgi:ribosomal protein S27E
MKNKEYIMYTNPASNLKISLFWEKDTENKSKDINSFYQFIEIIEKYPEWINQYPSKARFYCSILNKVDRSPQMVKVYEILLKKFPRFFSESTNTLINDLTIFNLEEALKTAIEFELLDLKWQCLILAYENSLNKDFHAILKTNTSENFVDILNLGIECFQQNIKLCFVYNKYRVIKISDLEKQKLNTLKKLNDFIEITGIEISSELICQQDLDNLTQALPHPYFLVLDNSKIEAIPHKWSQNILEIECVDCIELKNIDAPNAVEIYCRNCPGITTIRGNSAVELECRNLTNLVSIITPNARHFSCVNSNKLVKITAPNALWLNCYGCIALKKIFAPVATWITCTACIALTNINFSKTKWLNCQICTALTNIFAPEACQVNCYGCPRLATIIISKGCAINGEVPENCKIDKAKKRKHRSLDLNPTYHTYE